MIRNPFPGMNPYLEHRWGDVHTRLITYTADMVQEGLPPDLRSRMQERVFLEAAQIVQRSFSPDVHVYEGTAGGSGAVAVQGAVAAEPLIIRLPQSEITENLVEIIDARSGGRVITIIEFLSRANKGWGPGRDLYLQKQKEAQEAHTNLVEVDLLREGEPVTLAKPEYLEPGQRTAYHTSVWRAQRPLTLEYYPMPLRRRLPAIRIPLRPTDKDIVLDLQALVNLCYQRGRYDDIDYSRPPEPPLDAADSQWAAEVLKGAGGAAGNGDSSRP